MQSLPQTNNRLLSRQLQKAFPKGQLTDEGFETLIKLVNDAYIANDEERSFYSRVEKIANNELESVNKELFDKNEFLDSFNHGMAHDIKNHTSNIIGLVNMLKKYTEKQNMGMIKQITEKLEQSSNQLTSIVQGFLYLSRAENKVDIQFLIIEENSLINAVNLETKFLEIGKNVKVNYDIKLDNLFYSKHILKIILVNLISNSIKYSKSNEECIVNVTLSNTHDEIYIAVEDNGIGMDLEKENKKVFQLFNQMEMAQQEKGFGVGLFLIKKIIDRNKGRIALTSEPGIGTKVEIYLPVNS